MLAFLDFTKQPFYIITTMKNNIILIENSNTFTSSPSFWLFLSGLSISACFFAYRWYFGPKKGFTDDTDLLSSSDLKQRLEDFKTSPLYTGPYDSIPVLPENAKNFTLEVTSTRLKDPDGNIRLATEGNSRGSNINVIRESGQIDIKDSCIVVDAKINKLFSQLIDLFGRLSSKPIEWTKDCSQLTSVLEKFFSSPIKHGPSIYYENFYQLDLQCLIEILENISMSIPLPSVDMVELCNIIEALRQIT